MNLNDNILKDLEDLRKNLSTVEKCYERTKSGLSPYERLHIAYKDLQTKLDILNLEQRLIEYNDVQKSIEIQSTISDISQRIMQSCTRDVKSSIVDQTHRIVHDGKVYVSVDDLPDEI